MPSIPSVNRPFHAVVIGAGLGGLAAAQALSRHFERQVARKTRINTKSTKAPR